MRVWPIFKKELRIFFTSPVAYVILAIFLLVMGWFFSQIFQYYAQATVRAGMSPMMGQPELNTTDGILRPLFSNIAVISTSHCKPALRMRTRSPACTARAGFTRSPPTRTWPASTAAAARLRVR